MRSAGTGAAGMKAAWVLTDEERRGKEKELKTSEIQTIDSLVTQSKFFISSNVLDLDIHLVRQIVR